MELFYNPGWLVLLTLFLLLFFINLFIYFCCIFLFILFKGLKYVFYVEKNSGPAHNKAAE